MERLFAMILVMCLAFTLFSVPGYAFTEDDAAHTLLSDYLDFLIRAEQNSTPLSWILPSLKKAQFDPVDDEKIEKARLPGVLLTDYLDFLNRTEQNSTALLWAIPYVEKALLDNTWENVAKARLAVSTAYTVIDLTELAEEKATQSTYETFNNSKQDVSLVKSNRQAYGSNKENLLLTLSEIALELETGILNKRSVETLKVFIQHARALEELNLKYYACSTDYLLSELSTYSRIWTFEQALEESCPIISGYRSTDPKTGEELEDLGMKILDEIEYLTDEMGQLTTQMQIDLDDLTYAYENGHADSLEADQNIISNLPETLPFPLWDEKSESAVYFYRGKDGQIRFPKIGNQIEAVPDGCYLTFHGISDDDVYAYLLLLMDNGVEVVDDFIEDDSIEAHCLYDGIFFNVLWEPNTVTIAMLDVIIPLNYNK